jgi:selenocysteine lyase/cysteine desulfurase
MDSRRPIHLNTAGAGLAPLAVVEAMTSFIQEEMVRGAYETEVMHEEILNRDIYRNLASLINAAPEDIALFDSATRAWCSVIQCCRFKRTDRVWITPYEYAGNLIAILAMQKRFGFQLETVPILPNGDLDLDWMRSRIDEHVALASVVHIPSNCGIVNPVAQIGKILSSANCLYVVDACQSVGQLHIDVKAIACDVLTGAGRKFLCGPRGTGFAYVSPRFRARNAPLFHDVHVAEVSSRNAVRVNDETARAFEFAERSPAAVIGLNAALKHHNTTNLAAQADVYRELCEQMSAMRVFEMVAPGTEHSGILTFRHGDIPAKRIVRELAHGEISAWVAVGAHTPIYMGSLGMADAVRVSVHYYNTKADVAALVRAIHRIVRNP